MFGEKQGNPVNLIAVESFRFEGKHIERGTVLKKVDSDLAMELAGAGKVRVATEEAIKEANSAKENAEKIAAAQAAAAAPSQEQAIAAAVAAALKAAGIGGKA